MWANKLTMSIISVMFECWASGEKRWPLRYVILSWALPNFEYLYYIWPLDWHNTIQIHNCVLQYWQYCVEYSIIVNMRNIPQNNVSPVERCYGSE